MYAPFMRPKSGGASRRESKIPEGAGASEPGVTGELGVATLGLGFTGGPEWMAGLGPTAIGTAAFFNRIVNHNPKSAPEV